MEHLANVVIARRSMTGFDNIRGARLSVVCGSVWITQSGSTDDVCLDAGQSFRIARNGLTIVSATPESPFAVVMVEPHGPVTSTLRNRLRMFRSAVAAWPAQPATARL